MPKTTAVKSKTKAAPKTGYADGFVLLVPTKNMAAYCKLAKLARTVWLEYGALDYRETAADDMNTPFGLPFPKLTQAKRGETVVFSWITYKSRAHRDQINAKVMKDERLNCGDGKMPFDIKRMSFGGFKVIV